MMIRVLSISLLVLSLAAPAFAADGDCVPFWQCGTTPGSLHAQQGIQVPRVTELNSTVILAEFNDDIYNPYPPFGRLHGA